MERFSQKMREDMTFFSKKRVFEVFDILRENRSNNFSEILTKFVNQLP